MTSSGLTAPHTATPPAASPHRVEFGGPAGSPRIVLVHGLGGSHVNWSRLGPLLARGSRPVALDLAGFGRTPGSGRQAAVGANVALVTRFLREETEGAILVGNSMGGAISLLAAAAEPDLVRGLVLVDPALPQAAGAGFDPRVTLQFLAYGLPGTGELALRARLALIPAERRVAATLRLGCADPGRVPAEHAAAEAAMARSRVRMPGNVSAHLAATRSILLTMVRARVYWRAAAAIRCPVLLVHGDRDRLVPFASARAAAERFPHWSFHPLPGVGHIPHIEAPEELSAAIEDWMEIKLPGPQPQS
ncbi:MAG TPA: alpha/beta hydrolase [Actinocrinis sp.]